MSWIEGLTRIENKFLDRMRSPAALHVASTEPTGSLADFRGKKYFVLVTFKRDGTPVPSPLWFGVGDGTLYTHTGGWKLKRIAHTSAVLAAPSSFRGRPLGPPLRATARVLTGDDRDVAERAIAANYGWSRRVYYRLLGGQDDIGSYVEVTPAPA